jgi:hypothetical protein
VAFGTAVHEICTTRLDCVVAETVAGGGRMIPTVAVLDVDKLHAVFAVTVREMLPELPAWNVMFSPVTVPPVICHVWVMPERAGTEAVPVAPAWTVD